MAAKVNPARAQALRALLEKTDDAGERVYDDDDVFAFVPYVLLADGAVAPTDLSDDVATVLGAFLTMLGLTGDSSRQQVGDALRAYYDRHPVNEQLLADFLRFAEAGHAADAARLDAARRVLGQASDVIPLGARSGTGSKAGPLSRFSLKVPGEAQDRPDDGPEGAAD